MRNQIKLILYKQIQIIDSGDREEAARHITNSAELVEDNSAKISHVNSEFIRHKCNK